MKELNQVLEKYATSQALMDQIRYVAESLSMEFARWDDQRMIGPSLYFLIVGGTNFDRYTDPLGSSTWPVDQCRVVPDSREEFVRIAEDIAYNQDGAVVVTGDGTVQTQMVRVRSPNKREVPEIERLNYPEWMGTKQMNALETSLRESVLWVLTLSQGDGRVTTYLDGTYQDYPRGEIGGRWRTNE